MEPPTRIALGGAHQVRRADARAAERKLAAFKPQTLATFAARARLLRDVGEYKEAEKLGVKAVALDPSREMAYSDLAFSRAGLGKHEAAIATLREGLRACPNSGSLRITLAGLLRQKGRFDEALALYAEARRLDPTLLAAYYEEGYARLSLGEGVRALEILRAGVAASSGNPVAHHHLATGLWHRGLYAEGLAEMETTRRLFEARPDSSAADLGHTLYWLSVMYEYFKKPGSEKLLNQAVARWRSVKANVSATDAKRHLDAGDLEEAQAEATRGLESCDKDGCELRVLAQLLTRRATARQGLGKTADARKDAERALDVAFDERYARDIALSGMLSRIDVCLAVADFYRRGGDAKGTRRALAKARPIVETIPGHPYALRYREFAESFERQEALRQASPRAAAPLRGVILISVDALRADRVGARRGGASLTPSLDALAGAGVAFGNAVSQAPWTLPAMGTLFTSLHPWRHTLNNRFKAYDGVNRELALLPVNAVTLAEAFKRAGYDTAAFTGGASLDGEYGFDRGFDVYHDSTPFAGFEATVPPALDWLRERGGRPFFLFLHGYDVHGQHPETSDGRFRDAGYDGAFQGTTAEFLALRKDSLYGQPRALSAADRAFWSARYDERVARADERLGRFFAALDALPGVSSGVIVAVTSDHGEELFERGGVDHGITLYDEVLRVPLIVRDEAFLLQAQGETLRPFMEGKPAAPRDALSETDFLYRASKRSLRGPGGHKLIVDLETLRHELYDLRDDPGETRDLAPSRPEKVTTMERRLHTQMGLPLR